MEIFFRKFHSPLRINWWVPNEIKLGGAYLNGGANLREGACRNLDSKVGIRDLREGAKPNKYDKNVIVNQLCY